MHRNAFYVIYFSSIQEVALEKEDGALQFLRLVCKLSIKPQNLTSLLLWFLAAQTV